MKHKAKQNSSAKPFVFSLTSITFCIVCGLALSFYHTGTLFYEGVSVMRNISFESLSFVSAFANAVKSDLLFCLCVMVFSGGFPTVIIPPLLFAFKLFSLGITVGLAAKCCVFEKATGVFLSVFFSNILSIPLYAAIVFISLGFFDGIRHKNFYSHNMAKNYFLFTAKIFLVFVFMCISQLIQCGLGALTLKIGTF